MTADWDSVASDFEAQLDAVESLISTGQAADLPQWKASLIPTRAPEPQEQIRLESLVSRAAGLKRRLESELSQVGGQLTETARRRSVARAYGGDPATRA